MSKDQITGYEDWTIDALINILRCGVIHENLLAEVENRLRGMDEKGSPECEEKDRDPSQPLVLSPIECARIAANFNFLCGALNGAGFTVPAATIERFRPISEAAGLTIGSWDQKTGERVD